MVAKEFKRIFMPVLASFCKLHCLLQSTRALGGWVSRQGGLSAIRFAMAKSLKKDVKALSDPVQAALLKAAQRKMRCTKPGHPESAESGGVCSASDGLWEFATTTVSKSI